VLIFIVQGRPNFLQELAKSIRNSDLLEFLGCLYGSRDIIFYMFIFLTVCDKSVITSVENFGFSYFVNLLNELHE
jgi:hypothetical protein